MDSKKRNIAALFDFDGVIMDTETQYTVFWNEQGKKYLNEEQFGLRIKGQTLQQIYAKYFPGMTEVHAKIRQDLTCYEREMTYDYIPGVEDFLEDLHRHEVKIAVVTSSDEMKMSNVYRSHPEFKEKFDRILTADMFTRSKPAPDCFLLGMEIFGVTPADTFVFEDSFHGLQAGMSSDATVIGLATTNSREALSGKAHYILDNFLGMTFDKLISLHC